MNKKKIMPMKVTRVANIDYKSIATPKRFISEYDKTRVRRVAGLPVQDQRKIAFATKNACGVILLPYASTVC